MNFKACFTSGTEVVSDGKDPTNEFSEPEVYKHDSGEWREQKLWYNYKAEYWLFSLYDIATESYIFTNFPLLSSNNKFYDILCQLDYMKIGICVMLPLIDDKKSAADENNLGTSYVMIWGDNNE